MKIYLFLISLALSCSHQTLRGPSSLTLVAQEKTISSQILKGSVPYIIIKPEASSNQPLPVVYFLHGRGDHRSSFQRLGGEQWLRMHIEKGGKPFVVVALTGSFNGRDSYWVNDQRPGGWQMADAVLQELIPKIEHEHQIGLSPDRRMIAGISMGSHGAYQLALNSGGLFKCVAGHGLVLRSYESMNSQFPGLFGTPVQFAKQDPQSLIKGYSAQSPDFKFVWMDIGGADNKDFINWAKSFRKELTRLGYKPPSSELDAGEKFPQGQHNDDYWKLRMHDYVNWYGSCFSK